MRTPEQERQREQRRRMADRDAVNAAKGRRLEAFRNPDLNKQRRADHALDVSESEQALDDWDLIGAHDPDWRVQLEVASGAEVLRLQAEKEHMTRPWFEQVEAPGPGSVSLSIPTEKHDPKRKAPLPMGELREPQGIEHITEE